MAAFLGPRRTLLSVHAAAPPSGGTVFSAAYGGHAEQNPNTPTTTYTFPAVALGTPAATRRIALAVSGISTVSQHISSVSIGGVAATARQAEAADGQQYLEFWSATVPAGTTGDVVVTFTGTGSNNCGIDWWIVNSDQAAPYDVAAVNTEIGASVASLTSSPFDVPVGGIGMAVSRLGNASLATTWSQSVGPGTERSDRNVGTSNSMSAYDTTQAGAGLTVTTTPGGSRIIHLVAMSWGA